MPDLQTPDGMNARQQFAANLRNMPDVELLCLEQRTLTAYEDAKEGGHCALEAVLYFDLEAILQEMGRRQDSVNLQTHKTI